MAWNLVASTFVDSIAFSGQRTTSAFDTTGADLIVMVVTDHDSYPPTAANVIDNKGNTYTPLTIQSAGSGYFCVRILYCAAPTVGAGHTWTCGVYSPSIAVYAFSGSAAVPFDLENGFGYAAPYSVQPGSLTPSEDNTLIITGVGTGGGDPGVLALSVDSGFTRMPVTVSQGGAGIAYLEQGSAAAVNPTWTWDKLNRGVAVIASFKMASAGGGGITGSLAATETGSDTASAAGVVLVSGALSAPESGSDTAAATGTVLVSGALDATESGSDSAAATGAVLVSGSLASSESGADVAAFAGVAITAPSGTLAAVESGLDAASFAGNLAVVGELAASEEGSDTASFGHPVAPAPVTYGNHIWLAPPRQRRRQRDDEKQAEQIIEQAQAAIPAQAPKIEKQAAKVIARLERDAQKAEQAAIQAYQRVFADFEARQKAAEEKRQAEAYASHLEALAIEVEQEAQRMKQRQEEEDVVHVLMMLLAA